MSALAANGLVTIQAVEMLESILSITEQGQTSFSLSVLKELCSSRKSTMLSFNELAGLGLFYEVNKTDEKGNKSVQYLVNAKACTEILLNYKPELILGKRFYKLSSQEKYLFSGFVVDEGDIHNSIYLQTAKMIGLQINDVSMSNITAVEVVGAYEPYPIHNNNEDKPEDKPDNELSPEASDALFESLMSSQNIDTSSDELTLTTEDKNDKYIANKNDKYITIDVMPQYSIFGPKEGRYDWVTHTERMNDFPLCL